MVREWRRLKKIDDLTYIGECDSEHPAARVFGGHVLAQAMSAAYYTAPEGFYVHAVHCYFIRGGEESIPITYNVKIIRDGRNFAIRYVEAVQHGKVIHLAEFSLQKLASVKDTFSLTPEFPAHVPGPDGLISNITGRHQKVAEGFDARELRGQVTERMAPSLEIRPADLNMFLHGTGGVNQKQYLWIRYKIPVDKSDYMLRHATIVYLSDLEFDINDWILYEQECVANSNHRSLIHGRLWSRDGKLIMSTSQEALIYKVQPTQMGVTEGKEISKWFGPNTAAQVLKKLTIFDDWSNVAVHVALDNILVKEDALTMATTYPSEDAVKLIMGK